MEAIALLIGLLIIGLIIYSVPAINKFSEVNYGYDPFNYINLLIISIPCVICLLWLGIEYNDAGTNGKVINYKDLNHIVLYTFLAGSCILVFALIFSNTHNIIISLYSTIIILIGSILIAAIVFLVVLKVVSKISEKKKKH
jgi:hypothetical protein